jgi:predicted RND superfamily exporter protein
VFETLVGVMTTVGNALSNGDGLRLLIYGNTAVLLAINSIAGRSTARKKFEALRNKALTAGGPLTKQRLAMEQWAEHQRQRAELAKERVDARADRAKAAEQVARHAQNVERNSYGVSASARSIASIFKEANEKRDKEAEKTPKLILPEVSRRPLPQQGAASSPKAKGTR